MKHLVGTLIVILMLTASCSKEEVCLGGNYTDYDNTVERRLGIDVNNDGDLLDTVERARDHYVNYDYIDGRCYGDTITIGPWYITRDVTNE